MAGESPPRRESCARYCIPETAPFTGGAEGNTVSDSEGNTVLETLVSEDSAGGDTDETDLDYELALRYCF